MLLQILTILTIGKHYTDLPQICRKRQNATFIILKA